MLGAIGAILWPESALAAYTFGYNSVTKVATATGDASADSLTLEAVAGSIEHSVNGGAFSGDWGGNTVPADPTVRVDVVVSTGSGSTLILGTPSAPASALLALLEVSEGVHDPGNTVVIDDSTNSSVATYTLDTGPGFITGPGINYDQSGGYAFLGGVTLKGGTAANSYLVKSSCCGLNKEPITVLGGSANDSFAVTAALPLAGPVSIDGGGGVNTLDFSGSSSGPMTLAVNSGSVTGIASFTANNVQNVIGSGSSSTNDSDTFAVTPSATATGIYGSEPTPPTLPGDVLTVDTTATTTPAVSVTSTASGLQGAFTFGNAAAVNFQQIETLSPALDTGHLSMVATQGWPVTQPVVLGGTGTSPFSLAVNSGALAPGVGIDTATGALAGTPTSSGTFAANVTVSDTNAAGVTAEVSLLVNAALQMTPLQLPPATQGHAYSQTITVTGGTTPYTALTVTNFVGGTTGLTPAAFTTNLGAGTVTVAGTPTGPGPATFTVTVTDSAGAMLAVDYAINVAPAIPTLSAAGLALLLALLALTGALLVRKH
jgi:hypothetical protein